MIKPQFGVHHGILGHCDTAFGCTELRHRKFDEALGMGNDEVRRDGVVADGCERSA